MTSFSVLVTVCMFLAVEVSAKDVPNKRHADDFVGFTVELDHNIDLAENETVIYNKVQTNVGNGYDNTTGVFTCPIAGLYNFVFDGLSESAGTMKLDLYKNGEYQVGTYAHNSGDYAAATNGLTLSLNVGDKVYVRGRAASTMYGRKDELYNTFTGYLIVPHTQN